MTIVTLGVDLAKNVFQLHGVDAHGKMAITLGDQSGGLVKRTRCFKHQCTNVVSENFVDKHDLLDRWASGRFLAPVHTVEKWHALNLCGHPCQGSEP